MLEMKTMEKEKYRSMSSQTSDPKDVEDTSPVTFIVGANEGVTQDNVIKNPPCGSNNRGTMQPGRMGVSTFNISAEREEIIQGTETLLHSIVPSKNLYSPEDVKYEPYPEICKRGLDRTKGTIPITRQELASMPSTIRYFTREVSAPVEDDSFDAEMDLTSLDER